MAGPNIVLKFDTKQLKEIEEILLEVNKQVQLCKALAIASIVLSITSILIRVST